MDAKDFVHKKAAQFKYGAQQAPKHVRYNSATARVEYAVKGQKRSSSTSVVHVPGKGHSGFGPKGESANEQHIRLMREKLAGMDPKSKGASKLRANIDALESSLGDIKAGGGPKIKRPFKERAGKFKDEYVKGAKKQARRGGLRAIRYGTAKRNVKKETIALYGALGAGLATSGTGFVIMSRGVENQAKANTNKKIAKNYVGSKHQRKQSAKVRHGMALTQAGGMAMQGLGLYAQTNLVGEGYYRLPLMAAGVGAAVGYGTGYGFGRYAAPKNRISHRQKQWITYTRAVKGGPAVRVTRKNPYYGKKAKAKAARAAVRQKRKQAIKRKLGRR